MVRLRLHIEGKRGEVSFDSFVALMNYARLALDDVDRVISQRGRTISWRVADLGTRSLDAEIVGHVKKSRTEKDAQKIGHSFVTGIAQLAKGEELPAYFSLTAVERIRKLAGSLEKNGAKGFAAEYVDEHLVSHVSPDANDEIRKLTRTTSKAIGSVTGRLAVVSLAGKKNRFETYDELTRRAVRSTFADDRLEEVRAALGCRVIVSGIVWRNNRGQPLRVDQARITRIRPEEELPSTAELTGSDPGFTGSLSTEEYLRRLRDA